jgi:hypothetical protein
MSSPSSQDSAKALRERLAALGKSLGERERAEGAALAEAWRVAARVHALAAEGVQAFHAGAAAAGAEQLRVELSEPRVDDKHLRSVQFDLRRGRHAAIVTVKSRGDVTLVGPFRAGKVEGPCKSFPFAAEAELEAALGDFLARFLEEAATP